MPRLCRLTRRMARKGSTVEAVIAKLATRSHGVITTAAMLRAGISEDEIRTRARSGSLIRVHRGVYRVGHVAPSVAATYLAAVLACGDAAVLSGLAAAHVLGLVAGPPPDPEVSVPRPRRVTGVAARRCRTIANEDRITRNGIPVTSVPRTLVDLAGRLPVDQLVNACHEAGVRYRTRPAHVRAVLDRYPNPPGRARLVFVIEGGSPVSLSRLERRFLRRLAEAGLPRPDHTNRPAGRHRVDCRWITRQLTVELDSYRFHNSRRAFERDRRREREAYARGDQHRRYTWGDVDEDPRAMVAELSALLLDRAA
jgi:Transcriptional regulator, AbiEi antitoxin